MTASGDGSLGRLLTDPRSIAIIGASDDASKLSGRPVRGLQAAGFAGRIMPINPRATEVAGLPAYPSIDAVAGEVEVAGLIVPAAAAPAELRKCAAAGVRLAVIFSAGFAESGAEGAALQAELGRTCAETGIRLLGPNCLGTMASHHGAVVSFAEALARKHSAGRIALVSQSGALGAWVYEVAGAAGLTFSHMVNTGNEVDLTVASVMREIVEDDTAHVLVGYLEALGDLPSLTTAARRARALDKPIALLKVARSDAAARAALSHTASLAGSDVVVDAVLRQLGIVRVDDADQLQDAMRIFDNGRRPQGRRVTVVTPSGGAGIMMTDAAAEQGLLVEAWSPEWRGRLDDLLPAYASTANPIDVTAAAAAQPVLLEKALRVVLEHPDTDIVAVFGGDGVFGDTLLTTVADIYPETHKPVVVGWMGEPASLRRFAELGIPAYPDPARAIRAVGMLVRHTFGHVPSDGARPAPSGAGERARAVIADVRREGRLQLTEIEAGAVLEAYGIPVALSRRATTVGQAVAAAEELGYPVVVKVLSTTITHKSDVGGVRLRLGDRDQVGKSAADVLRIASSYGDREPAVVVQRMLDPGVETVLGMSQDPALGPTVLVGSGGVLVEILDDVALAVPPFGPAYAEALVSSLKGARLLDGNRGAPPADRAALVDVVSRFSVLAGELADEIDEIDVNPLVVAAEGGGVRAADALIRLREAGGGV